MSKKYVISVLNVLVIASLMSLQYGCRRAEQGEAQASIPQEKIISVMVYKTQPETISQYLKLTGGLEAGNETLVYSQTTEKLEQIKVKVGEQVKANQILAIQSGRTQQQSVKQAEASLQSAIAQEELAKKDHERNEQLLQKEIISKQVFDQTATELETARLAVEEARAQLAQSQEEQGDTVIKAPFDGKVAQIFFNKGDMVSSNEAVFKIVNTGTYKAKLDVPETDAAYISLGQAVIASFPAIPSTEFVGAVTRIDEAIDSTKRSLEVEVSFGTASDTSEASQESSSPAEQADASEVTSPQGNLAALKSGLFGQFKIEIQRHENTIVIPDNALMTQTTVSINERGEQITTKTYYAYVVEQGKALTKTVTPGIYSAGNVELVSGVNMGDAVIVTGQNIVKDGDAVTIANQ